MSKTSSHTESHTEILTVIEGEEYIFYTEYSQSMNQGSPTSRQIEGSEPLGNALSECDSTNHVQSTLGDYIGFSEFNSIIDDIDKE